VKKIVSFGSFEGFSGNFSKDMVERLKKSPLVSEIVPDFKIQLNDEIPNMNMTLETEPEESQDHHMLPKVDEKDYSHNIYQDVWDLETQFMAPRHLARISRHDKLPSKKSVNYYYHSKLSGKGVNAYIIDTGIFKEHPDLEGRAIHGADFTTEGPGDLNGHGTHVSGIIGSKSFGVAKGVTLIDVKALDRFGQGSLSTVISALEFAVKHRKENNALGVANLSLGAIKNSILNQAIQAAVESGLLVIAAAGNSNVDSCLTSPASSPYAITVGAIDDRTDSIATFSNWGQCVDVFASGVLIQSLSILSVDMPLLLSGTSMSSPTVTGLASILLENGVAVNEIGDLLKEISTKDKITQSSLQSRPNTPNRIVFNGIDKMDDEFPEEDDDLEGGDDDLNSVHAGELSEALNPQRVGELRILANSRQGLRPS
jgi:subtilase-type proteinase RRT12